ncbi:MAG: porin [Cytophagales bacterium]|nr:porin [Cytophagales bacterium]
MKNLKTVLSILLITSSVLAFAQEPVALASAKAEDDKDKKKKSEASTTEQASQQKKEEEEPSFTLSGSIDTYFHSSFNTKNYFGEQFGLSPYGPSTSFADLKGFSLGMVNLIASYSGEKAGFVGDVVFGPRGQAAVFGTTSEQAIINQAYAYYKFNDKVTLNLGQFNTFLGYEVISPAVNFHYSTSYLFSWGPFNHTGARLDFAGENGFVAKLAIMNPTDIVEFNPVNTYTLGAQLGKTSDKGGIWFNFLYGDQDGTLDKDNITSNSFSAGKLFQGDITLGYDLSDKFYLGLNTSYQTVGTGQEVDNNGNIVDSQGDPSSFFGVALYPKITISENFALGLRAEYFAIKNYHLPLFGLDSDGNGSVMEFTLSGNYKVGGLTFIPELRIDKTKENSFYKGFDSGNVNKTLLPTLNLAAVYKF